MSSADQNAICKNEASAVEAFLKNDSITMKNLIAERVKHMHWEEKKKSVLKRIEVII